MILHALRLSALTMAFALPQEQPADKPQPELLPPPKEERPVAGPTVMVVPAPPVYHRTNRYDVWQAYEVDRRGGFRARVIYSPSGAYYFRDGQPYPWTTTQPLNWKPILVD